jgi:hypothetical protein
MKRTPAVLLALASHVLVPCFQEKGPTLRATSVRLIYEAGLRVSTDTPEEIADKPGTGREEITVILPPEPPDLNPQAAMDHGTMMIGSEALSSRQGLHRMEVARRRARRGSCGGCQIPFT